MRAISFVGASGVDITRIGGGANVNVASIITFSINAEVETKVACAAVVITDIGAGGIILARFESAGIYEALITVTVETIVTRAALGSIGIICTFSINVARICGRTDVNVARSRIGPGRTFAGTVIFGKTEVETSVAGASVLVTVVGAG